MKTQSGSALSSLTVVVFSLLGVLAGCEAPESVRLNRGTGGRSDGGVDRLLPVGSGGVQGTGGFIAGSGGQIFGTGGTMGSGGVVATGGAVGTGGMLVTGGMQGSGGAMGTGGTPAGAGGGGTAGAAGSRGTGGAGGSSSGGAGGSSSGGAGATGGRAGTGGRGGSPGGANCITRLQGADYSSGTERCADCKENSFPRISQCRAAIDCMAPLWPCVDDCRTNCLNDAGASSVVAACVDRLTTAACN